VSETASVRRMALVWSVLVAASAAIWWALLLLRR
jgi:hypothetical protein